MESEKKGNKLKGAIDGLQPKVLFICIGAAGVLLLILRVFQTLFLMDPATGFFINKNNITVIPFYVLSIGLVIAAFVLFYLGRQLTVSRLQVRRSIGHGVSSLLFACALIYDAVLRFAEYRASAEMQIFTENGNAMKKLLLAYVVFAALSALVLLLDAIVFFAGAAFGAKLRILRLIPVFWAFFLTIRYFSVTASYIHSTQLFLTIFSSAFFMIFLFEYARKIAGVVPEENTAVFCASGLVSCILLFTVGCTDLLLILSGKGAMPHCSFAPYSLAGGLFCLTALELLKGAKTTDVSAEVPTVPLHTESDPVVPGE